MSKCWTCKVVTIKPKFVSVNPETIDSALNQLGSRAGNWSHST